MTNGQTNDKVRDAFVIYEVRKSDQATMYIPLCFSILERAAHEIVEYELKRVMPNRIFIVQYEREFSTHVPHHCYFNSHEYMERSKK